MASTRDIRRRIKSVKNTRQITKAMELVAASKMKKAQQAALAGRPYAELMARMLAAIADRVEETQHPFLVRREVRTRGVILITTDKGLAGPLNANLFKLVTEIRDPAKYVVVGRKGAQFIARTRRDLLADFSVSDKVPFAEVKVVAEFMVKQYLEGIVDTVEILWPRFRNTFRRRMSQLIGFAHNEIVEHEALVELCPLDFARLYGRDHSGGRRARDRFLIQAPYGKCHTGHFKPRFAHLIEDLIFEMLAYVISKKTGRHEKLCRTGRFSHKLQGFDP